MSEHSLPGCTTLVRWQCERLPTWCDATWLCTKLVRPGSEWVLTSLCTTLVRWCVANAPSWCSGVLFFYHTTQIGFQWLRPGGSHTKLKLDAFLPNFLFFQWKQTTCIEIRQDAKSVSRRTILALSFCFIRKRGDLYSIKVTGYKNAWCLQNDPPALILYMLYSNRTGYP